MMLEAKSQNEKNLFRCVWLISCQKPEISLTKHPYKAERIKRRSEDKQQKQVVVVKQDSPSLHGQEILFTCLEVQSCN
jgi:hypothetical protein